MLQVNVNVTLRPEAMSKVTLPLKAGGHVNVTNLRPEAGLTLVTLRPEAWLTLTSP